MADDNRAGLETTVETGRTLSAPGSVIYGQYTQHPGSGDLSMA